MRNGLQGYSFAFVFLLVAGIGLADEKLAERSTLKHQVTGLFSKDRIPDLQKTMQKLPDIELVKIDFDTSEAEFRYDAGKLFPNATPDQIVEQFDNLLRNASRHTFGIKPICKTPREKLMLVEIPVVGLDCKACCLAAYEAIYKLEGVERATASFKDGLVTAWIDSEKTDRTKLEAALKQRNVTLKDGSQ